MVKDQSSVDELFKALGDPTRLWMIEQLSRRSMTVGELAQPLAMSLAGASKHVGVLEDAGLLIREKRGRERICSLCPGTLLGARDWIQRYSAFWTARLDDLDQALKEDGHE